MPAEELGGPCEPLTISGPHRVYHVPPIKVASGLGVLSPPQAGVFAVGRLHFQVPMCLNTTVSPTFRWPSLTKGQPRIHVLRPTGLSLAHAGPLWIEPRLGFSPQLHTPPLPETHVRVGRCQTLTTLAASWAARTLNRQPRVARSRETRTHKRLLAATCFQGRLLIRPDGFRLQAAGAGLEPT